MKFNTELTEAQENEFMMADQFEGSSTEIRKHPEWHSYFMNSYWNSEKRGDASHYYEIADYISSHPSKKDMAAGKIGADFEYLYALNSFVKDAKGMVSIPEIPVNGQGYVDVSEAKFLLQKAKLQDIEHRTPLYTGRMPIGNDDNMDEIKTLMCEGNHEAEKIYDQLQSAAKSDGRKLSSNGLSGMEKHDMANWHAFSTILGLDDMNIRGQQIVDAYEYADHSVETFLDLIDKRDVKMCGYINAKCADRFIENAGEPDAVWDVYTIAREHGASFAHDGNFSADRDWMINHINARQLASIDIKPLAVDYSKLDITDGVDMKTGFKIIEAHGFEKYFERTVKGPFGDDRTVALFYNKHNGDIVEVGGAKEDNIVYAGVKLQVWRGKEDWHHGNHSSSGFEEEPGLGYNEFSHHEGLFTEYDSFRDAPVSEQAGREKLGFQGIGRVPIPSYIEGFCRDSELGNKMKDPMNIQFLNSQEKYGLEWMMDMMLAAYDPEIKTDICPDYERLKEDPYHTIMQEHGKVWSQVDMYKQACYFRLAASWMEMPIEEREKYYNALCDVAIEHDEKYLARMKENGWTPDTNDIAANVLDGVKSIYLSEAKHPEDIYAAGIPKLEETGLMQYVPWIDSDELDFDAAVAEISTEENGMKL